MRDRQSVIGDRRSAIGDRRSAIGVGSVIEWAFVTADDA
jgi:hypothetical protein